MKAKIAALALLTGSAFFSTDILAATTTEHIARCSNGFAGEIKYKRIVDSNKTTYRFYEYRMSNNGRTKGNININHMATTSKGTWLRSYRSPDNRTQNGRWHNTYVEFVTDGKPQEIRTNTRVEFIYDKKFQSDPRCFVNISH